MGFKTTYFGFTNYFITTNHDIIASIQNDSITLKLAGTSAALLPRCLSNFRAIRPLQHPISRLRDFTRFGGKTSYRLVNRRGPVLPVTVLAWCQMPTLRLWKEAVNVSSKMQRPMGTWQCSEHNIDVNIASTVALCRRAITNILACKHEPWSTAKYVFLRLARL